MYTYVCLVFSVLGFIFSPLIQDMLCGTDDLFCLVLCGSLSASSASEITKVYCLMIPNVCGYCIDTAPSCD